jgi:hypothetical protein
MLGPSRALSGRFGSSRILQLVVTVRFAWPPVELRHALADVVAVRLERVRVGCWDREEPVARDHLPVGHVTAQPLRQLLRFLAAVLVHLADRAQPIELPCPNQHRRAEAKRVQKRAPLAAVCPLRGRARHV